MLTVLPYFRVPVFDLGPIPVDPWATLVCIGFILGMEVSRARGIRLGLDVRDVVDGSVFTVAMGFIVGHLVHVLGYHPDYISEKGPVVLLQVWGGFSSIGGFLGAVLGMVLFYKLLRPRPFWLHADTIMYGFPFGWFFGRLGCASVHDHIGQPSDFLLALDFPDLGARHDLGLYEAMCLIPIMAAFFILGRKVRKPGFFTVLWCFTYAPARFLLDFLRSTDLASSDLRYLALTPAQYGCLVMILAGVLLVYWRHRFQDWQPQDDGAPGKAVRTEP